MLTIVWLKYVDFAFIYHLFFSTLSSSRSHIPIVCSLKINGENLMAILKRKRLDFFTRPLNQSTVSLPNCVHIC